MSDVLVPSIVFSESASSIWSTVDVSTLFPQSETGGTESAPMNESAPVCRGSAALVYKGSRDLRVFRC
jgi:hypothetical protein